MKREGGNMSLPSMRIVERDPIVKRRNPWSGNFVSTRYYHLTYLPLSIICLLLHTCPSNKLNDTLQRLNPGSCLSTTLRHPDPVNYCRETLEAPQLGTHGLSKV